ncbi:MAG: SAM-dependent methyltransferase [Flavobacteriales bacterium]|jgi:16S rRNA (cytidine1402-2'-O)-methyltransferase|nr:SAM-dependent methyltransferase [Flavobacteriales bacterium]
MALSSAEHGTLYLMPVWLGDHGGTEQVPPENIAVASRITLYFCEHERTARQMLRRMVPSIDLARLELHRLDKDSTVQEADALLRRLSGGRDAAIISEAGMPGIADPGALLVRAAHAAGITVVPMIGPSSLLLALAASGLNGQHFTFHGYLPVKPAERKAAIKRLEQEAQRTGAAQLFIETPYRNDALLADLLATCATGTALCVAIDLTQPGGSVATRTIGSWRKSIPALGKRPAVFLIGSLR